MPNFKNWTPEQIAAFRRAMKAAGLRKRGLTRRLKDRVADSPQQACPTGAPTDCVEAYADYLSALDDQIAALTKQRDELVVRMQHVMRRFTTPAVDLPNSINGQSTAVEDCRICS